MDGQNQFVASVAVKVLRGQALEQCVVRQTRAQGKAPPRFESGGAVAVHDQTRGVLRNQHIQPSVQIEVAEARFARVERRAGHSFKLESAEIAVNEGPRANADAFVHERRQKEIDVSVVVKVTDIIGPGVVRG